MRNSSWCVCQNINQHAFDQKVAGTVSIDPGLASTQRTGGGPQLELDLRALRQADAVQLGLAGQHDARVQQALQAHHLPRPAHLCRLLQLNMLVDIKRAHVQESSSHEPEMRSIEYVTPSTRCNSQNLSYTPRNTMASACYTW